MPQDQYEFLLGNIVAQGLILRGLWAKWAAENKNPAEWNTNTIEQLVASMSRAAPPANAQEERVWKIATTSLREFGEQVDFRLRGLGSK